MGFKAILTFVGVLAYVSALTIDRNTLVYHRA